jgi:hypothetical protein
MKPTLAGAVFSADVTPPLGTALCVGLVPNGTRVADPLEARGIVLFPNGQRPIVLCAVDWLGIGNGGQDRWRQALARAARTTPDRVAVHTVHQHDAPGDDATAAAILKPHGIDQLLQSEAFAQVAMKRVADAVKRAQPRAITAIGVGSARVERIASNRRILDSQGKFLFQRFTACRGNQPLCDAPEGVIDPVVRSLSFHSGDQRLATLYFYATHPMSYYGQGVISADFVGLARRAQPGFPIYFTGAAGNIGAGKYNDGAEANRAALAARLSQAMQAARESETRTAAERVDWRVQPVSLPHRQGPLYTEEAIERVIRDPKQPPRDRTSAGRYLAWLRLTRQGRKIPLTALHLGPAVLLHQPGELFVEYQLAAHAESRVPVLTAAYGDYGPMYIGTAKSYDEGGYETGPVSRVDPAVEEILKENNRGLLR